MINYEPTKINIKQEQTHKIEHLKTSKESYSKAKFRDHDIFAEIYKYQQYQTYCHVDRQL